VTAMAGALTVCACWASLALGHIRYEMLAGLGANVIVVEPPGGHELRHWPPFAGSVGRWRRISFILQHGNKRPRARSEWNHAIFRGSSRTPMLWWVAGRAGWMVWASATAHSRRAIHG
jgi:hypothetical protein